MKLIKYQPRFIWNEETIDHFAESYPKLGHRRSEKIENDFIQEIKKFCQTCHPEDGETYEMLEIDLEYQVNKRLNPKHLLFYEFTNTELEA